MAELAATPAKKSRGANPSADYKSLFLKSKDKYDRVSTDHKELVVNVGKAALKQQKLREELDFLLDAIASKQAQRVRIEQAHRDRALELEREAAAAVAAAAAARHHASSLGGRDSKRDRAYDDRPSQPRYDDDYRAYPRYADEAAYPAYEADRRRYASPPPPPSRAAVAGSSSSQRGDAYPASESSPPRSMARDPYASAAYRHPTSQSPPMAHRRAYEQASSPSRHEAHRAYRESTPPMPPQAATGAAVKRPRPTSVERELLEIDQGYDADPRDRTHHSKRARND